MNIASLVEGSDPSRVAVVDGDTEITYARLTERIAEARVGLSRRGIGVGSVVALGAGNEPDFIVATLAILGLGAIAMPLNPSATGLEFERRVVAGKVDLAVIGDEGRALFRHVEGQPDMGVELVAIADIVATGDADDAPPIVDVEPESPAFYMATSGVSGVPKIAVLSHGNIAWAQTAFSSTADPPNADDVMLAALPFTHIFGLSAVMFTALRVGATLVLQRRFDVDTSLDLVRSRGVTLLSGVPPMWQRWATADVADDALASVRFAGSGAAALPLGVYETIRDRFGIEVGQGYGLTETSSVATASRGIEVRPSSVGRPFPGVQIGLVDSEGNPVDVGDEGEIVIRHPGVFLGYLDDRESTESVLTADGWLWTGDVGILDDDGYLYLVDRMKDVIIVSGFNVYPAEVEDALMHHPDVTGVIVVGVADELTGEAVVAHVSGTTDLESLNAVAEMYLARYKRPSRYEFVDQLPIAPSGKAIRRELR